MVGAYSCKSGDTECEAAKNNMLNNQNVAIENKRKANSVAEIIEEITAEIEEITAEIAKNESEIKDLNKQITATEKKLSEEQTALAKMLVDMHFNNDAEPIKILAGSKSISDLAEKQARETVVKQEIAAASEKVKKMKDDLEEKKSSVEMKLETNENNRKIADSKRADQERLRAQFEKNADNASVLADYWENELKRLAYTPPSNTVGWGTRNYDGPNTYPYQDNCPQDNVAYTVYGGAVCQCTSYANWKAYEKWGIAYAGTGNAYNYVNAGGKYVPNSGAYTYVDRIAEAYTIAVKTDGEYGHVMWVESVNDNGTINITEYNVNWPSIGCYAGDFCSRDNVGTADTYFIHFR